MIWLRALLGGVFGIKALAIAGAVALAGGFFAGWKARDALCDLKEQRARIAALEAQIAARDTAARRDRELARDLADERLSLEVKVHELESKVAGGDCFDDADARRVRDLWRR